MTYVLLVVTVGWIQTEHCQHESARDETVAEPKANSQTVGKPPGLESGGTGQ